MKTFFCLRFYILLQILILLLIVNFSYYVYASSGDQTTIHIGVLTWDNKEKCIEMWKPTAEHLHNVIPEYSIKIVCFAYNEIEKAVYDGLVDFTITNPSVYVNLEYIYSATRIATFKDRGNIETSTKFGGVIIKKAARKDIKTSADLKGKRFGAVNEISFGGWLVVWRHLKHRGINPFKDFSKLEFLGQQERVVLAVQKGDVDAGAVRTGILEQMAAEDKINITDFEVIDPQQLADQSFPYRLTTELYPQWALAKVFHVNEKLAERVMFAFMQITPSSAAAQASGAQGWTIPLDYFSVHACLQELQAGAYKYLNNQTVTLYTLYRKYHLWVNILTTLAILFLISAFHVFILNRKLSKTMAQLSREHDDKARTVAALNEFKETLDKTSDCVFIFDPETLLFLYVNQGGLEQVGYSLDEMLAMKPTDIKPDFTEEQFINLIKILRDHDKKSVVFSTRHKTKNGEFIPVEITLQYITSSEGKHRCVAIVRNISRRLAERKERERLQTQLLGEQKLASVGQLAAGIAHEINTPAQYVSTNIEFLDQSFREINAMIVRLDQLITVGEKNQYCHDTSLAQLETIKEQIDWEYLKDEVPKALEQSQAGMAKINSIVLAMKEFSHPGTKEKQLTNLNQLIETTTTIARNEWKYVADIEKNFDLDLPLTFCLPNEISQVFLNILVNAAHAIAEKKGKNPGEDKGRITISSKVVAGQIEIAFTDTGNGIPKAIVDKIFDPFFTTKGVGRGTGQGLAIARSAVVDKHQGRLRFESEEGKGTTFIVTLPIVQ